FAGRLRDFLTEQGRIGPGSNAGEVDDKVFAAAAELVQTRIVVLSDAWDLLRFLFVPAGEFTVDEAAAAKNLGADAVPVLEAAVAALEPLPSWTTPAIEEALKTALIDDLGLKPRKAFAPVRVAVTGSHISPPLYESLELLGREMALDRLRSATLAS